MKFKILNPVLYCYWLYYTSFSSALLINANGTLLFELDLYIEYENLCRPLLSKYRPVLQN